METVLSYLPLFTVLLASFFAIAGTFLNSKQNSRYKWLYDFRTAMSNYSANIQRYSFFAERAKRSVAEGQFTIEQITEFSEIVVTLRIHTTEIIYLLNIKNANHSKFQTLLLSQQNDLNSYSSNQLETLELKTEEVYRQGKSIYDEVQTTNYFNFRHNL